MSADCVYDNYMISIFTRDAASSVYKQFRADVPVYNVCIYNLFI